MRVKSEVVAKYDESFGAFAHEIDDFGQVVQIEAIHFDHAQTVRAKACQASTYQRGFARTARAGEQHVVCGQAAHELLGIVQYGLFLPVNREQVVQFLQTRLVQRL